MNSLCIIFSLKGMGTCDSGPGQRGQRSADCYAQCREVTMLAPVAVTTRWCGRCPGLSHQIPAPSSIPRIGSVIAMSGRMWKALCRRKGRNISRPDLLHTHHPANLLEPASRFHESSLPSSFPWVSLRVAAQAGYFRHTLDRILPCIAVPQSIIGALLIPHNHWTIMIMIYRLIGTDSVWHSHNCLSDRGVLTRRGPVAKCLDTSAPLCSPNRHFILDKPPASRWNHIKHLQKNFPVNISHYRLVGCLPTPMNFTKPEAHEIQQCPDACELPRAACLPMTAPSYHHRI